TGIEARVKNMNQVGQTYNAVNGLLTADRVAVTAGDDQNFTYIEAEVAGVLGIIRALSVLTLLLSCVLILNTITTLVSEQTGIIGTMKALGGTRWRITRGYLLSIGIYSLIGTTLGIGLGLPGSVYLSSLLATLVELDLGPFQLPYRVIGLSLVVGLLVPLLAALLPLWNGTKITVHEAISAYGVVRGERNGRPTAFGRRLTWVSQTAWLGLRGLFRKPLRVGLTLLALTFSAATFTAIQISNTSVSSTVAAVNAAFSTDVTMDLQFLSLQNYSQFRSQILALPNVAAVERLHTQGDVSVYGQHLPIWGVEPNTTLYHYHLVAGRWFQGNEQNVIVLNDRVAQQLHLHVGSILPVTSQATARWQVIGIVHDLNITDVSLDQSLGSAYVPFDELVAISGNRGIHTLLIGARDRSPAAVDQLAGRLNSLMNTTGNYGTLITRAQAEQAQQGPGQITGIIFDAVAIIVGLVALLGLFNTLSTSVIERRLEIGILRSMGATGRRVAGVFWIEGLALVLLAWFGGVVLGIPGAALLLGLLGQLFLKFEFFLTPLSLVLTLAFALSVAFIANVGPAMSASRLRIREILRYE
ncbi:MAG TPA: FtsX-like permease family protein, partial [Ktedonobacteraceae bacterium]|nr:FtsX-like permease family protein [Ktedonobacteraceae bacterium]